MGDVRVRMDTPHAIENTSSNKSFWLGNLGGSQNADQQETNHKGDKIQQPRAGLRQVCGEEPAQGRSLPCGNFNRP
jgi:hypothetical protein